MIIVIKGEKKSDIDYFDYEAYFYGTKNILGDNDLYKSGRRSTTSDGFRMIFAYEGYAPKLVSHGENFKLQPGETLVMNCKFTDMSGLSRK